MAFRLSQRSLDRLKGVHPQLVETVVEAIDLTHIDFGVTCGLRTIEEQEKLVEDGKSQTMNSMHLPQDPDGFTEFDLTVKYNEITNGNSNYLVTYHYTQSDADSGSNPIFSPYTNINPYVAWELNLYDDICEAMRQAAHKTNCPIKWGAAWTEGDIRDYPDTPEQAPEEPASEARQYPPVRYRRVR